MNIETTVAPSLSCCLWILNSWITRTVALFWTV